MPVLVRRLLLAALPLAAIAALVWWLARPEPVAVLVADVEIGDVDATLANTRAGEVESCQRAKLSTIAGGRIEYIGVREGDEVVAGQLLMSLWNEDQQAQQAVARAALESARRRVGEICTQASNAADEAKRQQALLDRGFVSASREGQADADARARQAACATARSASAPSVRSASSTSSGSPPGSWAVGSG